MTDKKMQFDLAFTDCETTGLDPEKHEIVELAVVRVDSRTLEEKARFHRFFIPRYSSMTMEAEALAVNGYDRETWLARGAKPIDRFALDEISGVLRGAAFAGQNVTFDKSFVRGAYADVGLQMPPMDYHLIDVASLAWPFVVAGVLPGMSLKYTRKLLGLSGEQKHSALDDILDTIKVYRWIMSLYVCAIEGEALLPIESMSKPEAHTSPSLETAKAVAQRLANATGTSHEVRSSEGVIRVDPETP